MVWGGRRCPHFGRTPTTHCARGHFRCTSWLRQKQKKVFARVEFGIRYVFYVGIGGRPVTAKIQLKLVHHFPCRMYGRIFGGKGGEIVLSPPPKLSRFPLGGGGRWVSVFLPWGRPTTTQNRAQVHTRPAPGNLPTIICNNRQ